MGYTARGDGYIVLKKSALTNKGMLTLYQRAFGDDAKIEDRVKREGKTPFEILREIILKIDDDYGYVSGKSCIEMSAASDNKGCVVISLSQYDNYNEDLLHAFLDIFTPFVKDGNFPMQGEDGALWQIDFRHGWIEDNGVVRYATGAPLTVEKTKKGITASKDGESIFLTKKELGQLVVYSGLNKDKETNEEAAAILKNFGKCIMCDAETCLMNPRGVCLAPLLTGKKPVITDDEGCKDYVPADESMFL